MPSDLQATQPQILAVLLISIVLMILTFVYPIENINRFISYCETPLLRFYFRLNDRIWVGNVAFQFRAVASPSLALLCP